MAKRLSTGNRGDLNKLAADIVDSATEDTSTPQEGQSNPSEEREKNPAAVALGRLGGAKGGRARAKNLSKERLSEIGRKGAEARWKKSND